MASPLASSRHARCANDAFAAHKALIIAECCNPELRNNPYWKVIRREVYLMFETAYGVSAS